MTSLVTCPWCGANVATQKDAGMLRHDISMTRGQCDGSWRWPSEKYSVQVHQPSLLRLCLWSTFWSMHGAAWMVLAAALNHGRLW